MANVYRYHPESWGADGLCTVQQNTEISHATFCYDSGYGGNDDGSSDDDD